MLPLSSIKKSFSLPDFCKYFLVKISKFPGKFPVTNPSIFRVLISSIHIMYLFTIQLARIIFVNDYVKIENIKAFKNFLRISLKNPFPKNFLKQVQISIVLGNFLKSE